MSKLFIAGALGFGWAIGDFISADNTTTTLMLLAVSIAILLKEFKEILV